MADPADWSLDTKVRQLLYPEPATC
jgi:hypothetical protein